MERQFEVRDLGEQYWVRVKGRSRTFNDAGRDCAKRAEVASVFVALTLAPPEIQGPESATAAPDEPPSTSASEAAAPSSAQPPAAVGAKLNHASAAPPPETTTAAKSNWWGRSALAARAALAPRSDGSVAALGGELRFALGRGALGVSLGSSLTTATTLEPGEVRVRQTRVPVDLSLRREWVGSNLRGSLEVGAVVGWLELKREGAPESSRARLWEFGLRGAAELCWDARLAPYGMIFTEVLPAPRAIAVEPRGVIGHTSPLWVGVSAGLALRL